MALSSAAFLVAGTGSRGLMAVAWSLAGWTLMSSVGLAGGIWMVIEHGRPTAGFIVSLGTCILCRLIVSAVGAFAAASVGESAIGPYLVGLGAGYVPLQVYGTVWFIRRSGGSTS